MKKTNWTAIPTATPSEKGLMDSNAALGQPAASIAQVKLVAGNPGYLISTVLTATLSLNILVRITEHNYSNAGPGYRIIQLYPNTPTANNTIKIGTCSNVEVVNNGGLVALYVTPASVSGYSALIEVYAINTLSTIVNPGISAQKIARPAEAVSIVVFS